ncbi:DUF1187 family protein [Xenorhabdus budapestensis]|uniref:DUF1187 family protein n=1 Tax=Xenorhabdus budapestensis TaxID=290110 RepID=A0ABX7VDC0_XENBU|nr:DUF1187 family protein [Xenorhabdus budapestensis]QTL38769.1 DUF1187 family protein [Xenorhabdus budapestensis]
MKYQITATITKAGGLPVNWVRNSNKKLTKKECVNMVSPRRRNLNGDIGVEKVELSNFVCRRVEA